MSEIKDQLQKAMRQIPDFDKLKSHIEMTVTSEGLRIELLESAAGTFFESGSPNLNADGHTLLVMLAQELGKLPNKISVEGHTDSKPFAKSGNYGNWELSSDRANSARRLMQSDGLRSDQVTQVRGFADQRLRKLDNALDPSNRRISLIVQYIAKSEDQGATPTPSGVTESSPGENKEPKQPAGTPKTN